MISVSANELTLLFLGLELISIPTYVLLFLGRRDRPSAESTMKYFYLSLLASALLLYGFAFLYGIAGTTVIVGSGETRGIREAFLFAKALNVVSAGCISNRSSSHVPLLAKPQVFSIFLAA